MENTCSLDKTECKKNGYPIPARNTQLLQYLNLPGLVGEIIGLF